MMNDDEIDTYTGERDLHYVFDSSDKAEIEDIDQDFRLVKSILEDMMYSYSHGYKGKKEIMIGNMKQMVKQMGDLNIKRLMAHCIIFPRILNEFNTVLSYELEERRKK